MSLKLFVSDLNEIPEPLRPEYEERDGKFHLRVDGLDDVEATKSALKVANKEATERRKALEAWKALGKTPEEIQELLAQREDDERKKAEQAGDYQKILEQHQTKWQKERDTLETELKAARESERNAVIENHLLTALKGKEDGSIPRANVDGLDLLPERLASRIQYELQNGKRVLRIMAADGETPMAGAGKDGMATFDDLVKEAAERWPSLFEGRGRGGSGMQPTNGAGRSGQNEDLSNLLPAARLAEARRRGTTQTR